MGDLDPDAALMLRVKRGDTAAFEGLVEKYKQPVMNLVYRILKDATEAEDMAQQAFLQAYKSADRYRVSAKFSTWLFTIARNLCLNEIRRRSRHPTDSMEMGRPHDEDEPLRQFPDLTQPLATEEMLHRELLQKLQESLDELPENQRTALTLFREEELSYEDIGRVLGCSLSATKSLIHRARETLKQKLKPYLRSGTWPAKVQTPLGTSGTPPE